MFLRFLAVVSLFVVTDSLSLQAHGNGRNWRSPATPGRVHLDASFFGNPQDFSYGYRGVYPNNGYGYTYDPYRTGSFKAPDLMDDPYFRSQMNVGRRRHAR
ncbi:hypothetical protein [Roseimaritima multifibrata]|uniref:hypothetical protein n=1 Tax=Roseimaritima multifibrata TaxID=1930274 RepID=UPI0011A58926|nr:hypothetical protein [Roseimaritima multifibrata]